MTSQTPNFQSGILAKPTDPKVTARDPEDGASSCPPMYHILKSESLGSRITHGCPTDGRSQLPSGPAENTGNGTLFESCDMVQLMPSVDVANPIPTLLVPEVMLNHMR